MQENFLNFKCPQCGEELKVPQNLETFSCMYCGARLSRQELMHPADLQADPQAYEQALKKLSWCILNFRGYQNKITRGEYEITFEAYLEACRPIFEQLERGVSEDTQTQQLTDAAEKFLTDLEADWAKEPKRKAQMMLENDKIVIAIFFVPMVRKLQLSISEEFSALLQQAWMKRYPKSPFYLAEYERIAEGFQRKRFGLCFITTAVCQSQGKPDDCEELTAFRAFRDGYLSEQEDGPALIAEYYNIAPGIVSCIDYCTDKEASYEAIRETYLQPCYEDLQNGDLASCKARYVDMVRSLEKQYLS